MDILNVKGPGAVRNIWQLFAEPMEIEITLDGAEQRQARVPAKAFYGVMLDLKDDFSNSAGIVTLPNPAPGMPGNLGDNYCMPIRRIRIHATEDAGRVVTVVNWHQYQKNAATDTAPLLCRRQRTSAA